MSLVCAFDQTTHADVDALHAHLKRFKVSRERYYHTYEERRDRVTGELIPFKDLDQYRATDFVSKVTLKRWLKENPVEGWAWAKAWLARRKADKGLVYAPSQVELRTLTCPSIPYYDKVGAAEGGYDGVTAALGFAPRYTAAPLTFTPLPTDAVIIQDTREQMPVRLECAKTIATLDVGDYALAPPYDRGIHIERKSLSDWCGTLSGRKQVRKGKTKTTEWSNLERFDRELARAQAEGLYVVMMVEASITDAQSFDYLPQTKWIKASPAYILHNLRELLVKYPLTFQCVFVDGRAEMATKMVRVFELGEQVKSVDLQLRYEQGEL